MTDDILAVARTQVLGDGIALSEAQAFDVLRLGDERVVLAMALDAVSSLAPAASPAGTTG